MRAHIRLASWWGVEGGHTRAPSPERAQGFRWEVDAPSCTHTPCTAPATRSHCTSPTTPQQRQHPPAPQRTLTQCRRWVPPCRPALHTRADGTHDQ
jgi:hypothetical protein